MKIFHAVLSLFVLALAPLVSKVPIEPRSAYWDGNNLLSSAQISLQRVSLGIRCVEGPTIFFQPIHPHVYGHILLDGCFTLYTLLREQNLLHNPSVNLLLVVDAATQRNSTFMKMLDLIKRAFHFKEIFLSSEDSPGRNIIFFKNLLYNNWQNHGFYVAYPESYDYMYRLREYGFQENVVFQDPLPYSRNPMKDFVDFVCAGYGINPADWPLIPNRMIIAARKTNRKILNTGELEHALQAAGYDVVNLDFDSLTMEQQIIEMMQAEYLLGTYGSNLTNAIFLDPAAKVVVVWPRHGKFFISRSWDTVTSAFLAKGVTLVEYDKPDYDLKDEYTESAPYPTDWFDREGNILKMNPQLTLDMIVNRPHPILFHLFLVNIHVDPQDVIGVLQSRCGRP